MKLMRLTDRIFCLPHEAERDRPMLAYVRGDRLSLGIDAGYSADYVDDFYAALKAENLKKPGNRTIWIP